MTYKTYKMSFTSESQFMNQIHTRKLNYSKILFYWHISTAIIVSSGALAIQKMLQIKVGGPVPFFLLSYPTVFGITWLCGMVPGLIATALTGFGVLYFFIPPLNSVAIYSVADLLALCIFLTVGLTFSVFIPSIQIRQNRARLAATRESLKLYELMAMHCRDIILFIRQEDGKILECNKAATLTYGFSQQEFKSLTIKDLLADRAPSHAQQLTSDTNPNGILFESIHRRKDGSTFPVEISSKAGVTIGDTCALISVIRDISKRKKAEEALLTTGEHLRISLASNHMATFDWDIIQNKHTWDNIVHELFGTNPETFRGTTEEFYQIVHPDDLNCVKEAQNLAIKTGHSKVDFRVIWPDGSHHHISSCKKVYRNEAGVAHRMIGICWDVTEQKVNEKALRLATESWLRTFDAIPDLIAILDSQHRITLVNKAMALRLKKQPHDCTGLFCYNVVHGLDAPPIFCPHSKTICDGHAHIEEVHEIHIGGDFLVSTTPIAGDDGKILGSVHVARDITDRKKMETELRCAIESQEEFLAIASHDLKAPLTDLYLTLNFMEEIVKQSPMDQPQLFDMISHALKSGQQLVVLLDELLDITRIRAGKLVLEKEDMDLKSAVLEWVSIVSTEARQKGSQITVKASDSVVGEWDPVRINQVISNLLSNAIKYGEGKPIEVTVLADLQTKCAKLIVRDQGIGVPLEMQSKIFKRFERAVSDRMIHGLGLGLYIVGQIVHAHGGSISLKSEPGKGSQFTVLLPLSDIECTLVDV